MSHNNNLQIYENKLNELTDEEMITLTSLSQLEQALVALNIPFQLIYKTPTSRWQCTKGRLTNVPLPADRVMNTTRNKFICRKSKKNTPHMFLRFSISGQSEAFLDHFVYWGGHKNAFLNFLGVFLKISFFWEFLYMSPWPLQRFSELIFDFLDLWPPQIFKNSKQSGLKRARIGPKSKI